MHDKFSAVIRTDDGGRVVVTARFTEKMPRDTDRSVEHEPLTETYTDVSFTGEVFDKGQRTAWAAGQVGNYLPEHHPLRLLWKRWHLNGMRSHCAHQNPAIKWDETPDCLTTGYRCGTAWLIEPVPVEVVRQIIALMTTNILPVAKEEVS